MSDYQQYHTDLKIAVKAGLVSDHLLKTIPRTTRHRFKSQDFSKLLEGQESALLDHVEKLKEITQSKLALSTALTVLRIASFVKSLGLPFHKISSIKIPEIRKSIVEFIRRVQPKLTLVKTLKYLGLSVQKFYSWSKNPNKCLSSPLGSCRKAHPNQLTPGELRAIRKAFTQVDFSHWPASSIAWHLIHTKSVSAHVRTITNYAKVMGLTAFHPTRKIRKRGSLATSRPNEAWHMDTTVIVTQNHEKAYLQILMDNYSRKILSWKVSASVSGLISTELLRTAFAALGNHPPELIKLIVDGGSENSNRTVSAFLESLPIKKLIAQVDVTFSNSIIEAVNKIVKYNYLFRKPIPDLEHLPQTIENAVLDYNNRPHSTLYGLTPAGVYQGEVFNRENYKMEINSARLLRLEKNRLACPPPCLPLDLEPQDATP